ncbi:MAG: hypothetical protein COB96_06900 [Planctomycetota bacterium]|nr:MAG: hypothetical protein COB96_06900 [Planctomycetota bacterium]
MLRNILTGVAVIALCAGAAAQNTANFHSKANTPVKYLGEYEMASGEWSLSSRAGTRVLYNCTTWGNYFSTVGNSWATNADHLWIDEGYVQDSNSQNLDQVNGFDFAYCSSDFDPTGNSGAILIAFYDDYVPCTSPPAATCAYIIGGLPLSTTGNTACWGVGIDLAGGFECSTDVAAMFRSHDAAGAMRYFGWAFGANPGMSLMNDTGPILDLPCAAPLAGCGNGNENFFWWEDPTAYWSGCYWFGGIPYGSFSMKMYGGGSSSLAYGHTNNTLVAGSSDYAPGTNVTWSVSGHSTANTLGFAVGLNSGSMNLGAAELVISYPFLAGPFTMDSATGTLTLTVPAVAPPTVYGQVIECAGTLKPANLVAMSNGMMMIG